MANPSHKLSAKQLPWTGLLERKIMSAHWISQTTVNGVALSVAIFSCASSCLRDKSSSVVILKECVLFEDMCVRLHCANTVAFGLSRPASNST